MWQIQIWPYFVHNMQIVMNKQAVWAFKLKSIVFSQWHERNFVYIMKFKFTIQHKITLYDYTHLNQITPYTLPPPQPSPKRIP